MDINLKSIEDRILFENSDLMVINKPYNLPVHSGYSTESNLIDIIKKIRNKDKFISLFHRLDKETSGCLIITKNKSMNAFLNEQSKLGHIKKTYLALTFGKWKKRETLVKTFLKKNTLLGGERLTEITSNINDKLAITNFVVKKEYKNSSLTEVEILTGKTHQIRAHAAFVNHPIALDKKYGSKNFNKFCKNNFLTRLFLHSYMISFPAKINSKNIITIKSELDNNLKNFLLKIQ